MDMRKLSFAIKYDELWYGQEYLTIIDWSEYPYNEWIYHYINNLMKKLNKDWFMWVVDKDYNWLMNILEKKWNGGFNSFNIIISYTMR